MGIDAVVLVFGFWFLPALFHICPHPEILWLPPIWCVMPIVHNQILKDFQSSLLAMIFMLSQVRFERKGKYMHAQYCPALSGPMDCSPLGSSVNGIFQARILAWVAISSSSGSFQLRDWIHIFCIGRQILYCWTTWKAPLAIWYSPTKIFRHFIKGCIWLKLDFPYKL